MAASSQIGNIDQEFFLFNRLYKIVDFEAFLGPARVSPRKTSKNSCAQSCFSIQTRVLATGLWWLWCTIEGLGTLHKCYVSSPVVKTLVLDWKSWLAQQFLDVFLGLTLTGSQKASKSTILYNRLNQEKTPGRCCQSGYLLPWWLWCTIHWRFWEPCANAMLVVSLVSQPFRPRARALAENDSLQRVIRMQRVGESFSANARARIGGKVVRPRRLLT